MKRRMLAVVMLCGCGPVVTEPMPDIPETVEYETVRVEYGTDDLLPDGPADVRQNALVGEASTLANLTRDFVRGTNQAVRDQLGFIDEVTSGQPSSFTDDTFIWEASLTDRYVKMTIVKESEESLSYEFLAGRVEADAVPIFTGQFTRRDRLDGRQAGFGIIRLNFDNIRTFDPNSAQGRIAIAFRAVGGVRQVRTSFFDFAEFGKVPMTATYEYVQLPGGQGRFKYGARQDFKRDGEPLELVSFNGAWTAEQAGRVAVRVNGGSLEINEFLFDECWDAMGLTTFADARPDIPTYDGGSPDDCDVSLRALMLAAPEFVAPTGDPEVPAAHPDEM